MAGVRVLRVVLFALVAAGASLAGTSARGATIAGPAEVCAEAEAAAVGALKLGFAPIFGRIRDRIPAFGEWTFSWSVSYERDRQLFWSAARSGLTHAGEGEVWSLWPAIERDVREQIASTFRSRVLHAEVSDRELVAAWEAARLRGRQVLAEHGRERERPALPLEAAGPDPLPHTGEIMELLGPQVDAVLIRTARPMIARLAGWLVRISAGVTTGRIARATADVTDLGLWGYGPGILIGLGVAVTTSWTIDYLISSTDDWLNRSNYESELAEVLEQAETIMTAIWSNRLRFEIDRQCRG
jgi:hypothetical protein